MLASKYMRRGEYDRTEEILSRLPENNSFDKTQMQVNLYLSQNRLAEAARLEESKLVTESNSLVMRLVTLMEIAVKEGRMEDARRMAEAASSIAKALDMWEYTVQLPWFELYAYLEDRDNCLKALDSMLVSVTKPWDTAASPLYCHLSQKEQDNRMGEKIKDMLLVSIEEEEQFAFLRQDKRFEEMKKRLGL